MTKEEFLNEIEMAAISIGIDSELTRILAGKIALILKDVTISESSTALALSDADEDIRLIRKFLISKKIKGCTERTIYRYENEIKAAIPRMQKPLKEVTSDDIGWLVADKEFNDGCSRVTCSNTLRVLSSLFQFLSNEGYIQGNPVMKFGTYKVPKQKKEAFTEWEIETMRDSIRSSKEKAIFEILLSTGCRVSELCQIKLKEIKEDEILVHGKGQKDRVVHLNVKAKKALEDYICQKNEMALKSEWLFPKKEYKHTVINPEEHMDKGTVEAAIRRLGEKHNIKAHPHKFRRTCATLALKRGMDLMYVSKMLGHENVQTTQIYLDLDESSMKEQHKRYVI